jgi:hypothetical protein
MAHWKKSFPSRYLQVSDLDRPLLATIASVTNESVSSGDDQETKPVVKFQEPAIKSLILNMTRSEAIEAIVDDPDTDTWPGTKIKIVRGTRGFKASVCSASTWRRRMTSTTQCRRVKRGHSDGPFSFSHSIDASILPCAVLAHVRRTEHAPEIGEILRRRTVGEATC